MNRREAALSADLESLRATLARMPVPASLENVHSEATGLLDNFLLPRLDPGMPQVAAIVGSTGAGKSTLLNSLAGELVSMPGPLRPTTKRSRVWVTEKAASRVTHLGATVTGEHPLLQHWAVVDTPDLDSDVTEHQGEALAVAAVSDVIVFVTTAARYGDVLVWKSLNTLARDHPMVVVLNRVPGRASGARNDLLARLRTEGLDEVPVFTIYEQRVNPERKRLNPQSVEKLAAYLRDRSFTGREESMDLAADRLAELLSRLKAGAEEEEGGRESTRRALKQAIRELEQVVKRRFPWVRTARQTAHLRSLIEERLRQALPDRQLSTRSLQLLSDRAIPLRDLLARLAAAEVRALGPQGGSVDELDGAWRRLVNARFTTDT